MDIRTRRKKRKEAKKKILLTTIGVLILAAALLTYVYTVPVVTEYRGSDISPDVIINGKTDIHAEEMERKMTGIVNIALFGLDEVGTEACRTDTIMILTIDNNNKKVKLTSIMRDMYVEIPGKWKDRINAAYAYGGPELAVNTINKNFNINIKYYASADFTGLQRLINKLGGVDIDIKEGEIEYLNFYISELSNIDDEGKDLPITKPGVQHLTGKQAVGYMRIRYYGNGDFERTQRQRVVLNQLFEKSKKAGIFKISDLVSSVLSYIQTNMNRMEILSLGAACLKFGNNIEQCRLPVDGTFEDEIIEGMWVLVPDLKENIKQLHEFIYGKKRWIPAIF